MTVFIVLPVLTLLMFDLGLALRWADFQLLARHPRALCAGLLGQLVVLPLVAYAVGRVLGLDAVFFAGVMLIACCPGGSSSNVFSMLAGGDVALSVSLTAASSLLTLLTMPVVLSVALAQAGIAQAVSLPVGSLIGQNLVLMFVPIALGMLWQHYGPRSAARLHGVLRRLAFPLLILLATVFFLQHTAEITAHFATLGLAATLLVLLGMCGGALLARLFRLDVRQRKTLVIEVGMQNAAEAIALALSPLVFNSPALAVPAILYALMMNVVLLAYVAFVKRNA